MSYRARWDGSVTTATFLPTSPVMTRGPSLDRRTFVRRALGACAGTVAAGAARLPCALDPREFSAMPPWSERHAAPDSVRIALVMVSSGMSPSSAAVASCRMGAELGCDEAARAAALLQRQLTVVPVVHDLASARTLIAAEPLSAIIAASNAGDMAELGERCTAAGVVLINASASEDALRNAQCNRMTFHVAASDAMRSDALRRALHPTSDDASSTAELWNAGLERFGAAQLNDRFHARFGRSLDTASWAGWFAVKVAWEASQRARSFGGAAIARYLERETTAFDGHKGVPLSFRSWDHQLRQPLYVRRVPGTRDAPVSGERPELVPVPADPAPSRAALDSLGTSDEVTTCQWR
jgi:hypothetical protein